MGTVQSMHDRPTSPPSLDGATEMNEVSREFTRTLSMSNNDAHIVHDDAIQAAIDINGDIKDIMQPKPEHKSERKYIAPNDFEPLKVIGIGAFGKVLQVRNRHSSEIFAMKVISKRQIRRKGSYVENILAERNILSLANHPFIVTMHASFQTREKLFIIMDLCAGGELFLKLGKEGIFRERTAAFYLAEIILALEHLHSINVLHRDLKPENILLGADGHCCVTDFGLARHFGSGDNEGERAKTLCGTIEYMAPEMVARKGYGKGADFWSLGCVAFEMLSGLPPFSSKKGSKELFRKIMNERIRMPDGASAEACKLLKGLLNRDAGKRLGAARGTMLELGGVGALKQQAFFSVLDWGKLELKEIEPPESFSIDHEEDLQHFHEEFVSMTLPRSVKEMSKLDFLPKRCVSQNFRGFSFIGDSFPTPDRTASEQEHYWNNIDEDGQSLSDCASSICDENLGDFPVPEPVPEKKKRPPRKKKKKQQLVPPLETTHENGADDIAIKDTTTCSNGGNTKVEMKAKKGKQIILPSEDGQLGFEKQTESKENVEVKAKKDELLLPSGGEQHNTQSQATSMSDTHTNALARSLNPNAQPRGIEQTRPAPQASPVATPSYTPKPGTWASLTVGKGKAKPTIQRAASSPFNNRPTKATTASPMVIPHAPQKRQTSLDWTTHSVSPHPHVLSPKSISKQNLIPPPLISQPAQKAWPSLGDFPPPSGATPKEQKKPKGVWGSRS